MMTMRKWIVLLMIVANALGSGCRKTETRQAQPQSTTKQAKLEEVSISDTSVGATMPAYSADLLDGSKFDVVAERGTVLLLNLWATWCGPCRYEIPELEDLHQKYAPRGFKVVGVSLDESGRDVVKQFVGEHKMTYPVALDPEGKLANVFQTTVVPTSVVIDRTGKIVWKHYGAIGTNDDTLIRAIDTALARK